MTENETIKRLQTLNIILTNKSGHKEDGIEKIFTFSDITAICKAIQALEEIQQIKEIILSFPLDCGSTVEDIREIYRQLRCFLQIGTIEEFKVLKEKSEPKKPILSRSMMTKKEFQICPVCERLVLYDGIKFDYCQYCGQKLDWQ